MRFLDTSRSKKDGEIDGQDYHFITRVQFEADILVRKFVEHGEYEKAYYGNISVLIEQIIRNTIPILLDLTITINSQEHRWTLFVRSSTTARYAF